MKQATGEQEDLYKQVKGFAVMVFRGLDYQSEADEIPSLSWKYAPASGLYLRNDFNNIFSIYH